ncbi:N-acetylmuramoyl-L-alanine amidase [Micromonospora pallida]|uniref:N-acetylmuramoyl-L-alanine amidase n=1 Tax=Micromonospora pallida TaxID=145854 RepID=A0A1C6TNS7_9ACTN|nr:N-acetylmuramoyl-L-alanine amidase [Micromonospora pallida]SCL43391.1 N-acetylmuramoyl-L-alanine amidase [Micromonospora pallida]
MKVPGIPFKQGRNAYDDRDGQKFGIAIHATDNTATAEAEASYATRRTDGVGSHFYVDGDSVVQSLDTRSRAGHAGSSTGNENGISVEITGRVSASRQWWLANVAWDRLAEVLAVVCREYDIAPRRATVAEMKANPKVRAFYGHNDMRLAWGGTSHTDPGPNFPWDHLLDRVKRAMNGDEMELTDPIKLVTGKGVAYSSPTTTVAGVLSSTNYYVLQTRNSVLAELADARVREEAILAAVTGGSQAKVLEAIQAQGEQTRRQLAEQAATEAARDAELRALVEQGQDGTLDATEVLRRMGELLATAGQGQARE